ncbi:MAG: hypothetical protein B0A82_25880 [Alkalinema sp. CACIAM 70d]|nr:MAG: hypothetical protein B0A82_25880 [Alkalinema sp. CACIAM 70d]
MKSVLVCLYEDRPQQIPGIKLTILSLTKHHPHLPISLICPIIDTQFHHWLSKYPQVSLRTDRPSGAGSYNVKPTVLIAGLQSGAEECIWLDTDVLVNHSILDLVTAPPETIIVTQDPWETASGSSYRAGSWGFVVGRDLPGSLNSSVIRVTHQHQALLQHWLELTQQPEYLAAQKQPAHQRPSHLLSDQDLLSALLASQDYAHFPVKRLFHGRDILQHHGAGAYTLKERSQTIFNKLPPFLHAMGSVKPWQVNEHPSPFTNFRQYYERVYLELSPYVHVARQYRQLMEEPTPWMDVQTLAGKLSTLLWLNQPSLKGITQASLHRFAWKVRNTIKGNYS